MWREVDGLGVDSIWPLDHFFPLQGDPFGSPFDGWTLLADRPVSRTALAIRDGEVLQVPRDRVRAALAADAGEAYLSFWAKGLEQYRRNMDAFFRVYWGLADTNGHEEEKKDREPRESPGGSQETR